MNGFKPLTIFKDLIDGVKTDDDKLAKQILSNIDKIEDAHRQFRYLRVVNFKYNGFRFELLDGAANMYSPGKSEAIKIKSKFLSKLWSGLLKDIDKKDTEDRLKKYQEDAKLKDIEFADALKQYGGITSIAETILDKIKDPKSYWKGQIRLDKNRELVMLAPTNDLKEGRRIINTLIVDLNTGVTRLEKSYGAYVDHKRYDGILNHHEIESLQKYVQLAKDTVQMKDDEKAIAINNLINLT